MKVSIKVYFTGQENYVLNINSHDFISYGISGPNWGIFSCAKKIKSIYWVPLGGLGHWWIADRLREMRWSEEKGLLWETRDQRRRVSPDNAGMKNISAEVSIFCMWTNWIHLIICSTIEFRKLYYCSGCALHKICEMCTFDRCPRGWSDQKSFLACGDAKKENWKTTKL